MNDDVDFMAKPFENRYIPNEIDIADIVRYCFCPVLYKIKRELIPNGFKTKYANTILACCYSFLNILQNDPRQMGYMLMLKRKWGYMWIKDVTSTKKDLIENQSSMQKDTFNIKRVNGMNALINFHDMYFNDIDATPVIVGKKFMVKHTLFGTNKEYTVTGTWDCIAEYHDELVMIKIRPESGRSYTKHQIRYDLSITFAVYAFRQIFMTNNDKPLKILIMDLESNKLIESKRTEQDFVNMWKVIDDVIKSISKNIVMASTDVKCYHCDVRTSCMKILDTGDLKLKPIKRKKGE